MLKNKTNKKPDHKKKKGNFSEINFYLVGTVLFVLFIYLFSLFRPWQPFDEDLFYKEDLFPIPVTFNEIFEVIKTFVANYHIESMNNIFSNQMTIRSNPIAGSLVVFVSYFLKKNALLYHVLQLSIHLINTILVWFILKKISFALSPNSPTSSPFISFLTLIWSLHSANTEAILLVTNWDTLLTYTFCFGYLLFEISSLAKNSFKISNPRILFISILFCLTMFLTEYGYTFPLIIFFTAFSFAYKHFENFNKAFITSLKYTMPYFIGLFLFIIISGLNPDSPLINLFSKENNFYFFLERNLWFVPQIFVHTLKLIIFPKTLSTYQSNLIHFSPTLFDAYSIFCTLFYILFLLSPFILFFVLSFLKKQKYIYILPLIYAFYFSLFPFLQILLPTYCLSADRYCYFPTFFLILIILNVYGFFAKGRPALIKPASIFLACLLAVFSIRTLIRIQDWSSPYSFYKSAVSAEKNPLYKGHRLMIFADCIGTLGKQGQMEETLKESLSELHKALKQFKKLRKQYPIQPVTLKFYGLDYDSLVLKSAYLITAIRNDNYREDPKKTIAFYEPFIKKRLDTAAVNYISLYAEILLNSTKTSEAKDVLEYTLTRFPYYSKIIYQLADIYFSYENDGDKTYNILQKALKYFPNKRETIYKLLKYYEKKGDLPNQAYYLYLFGLRQHSPEAYYKAAQLYLDLNQAAFAKIAITKLIQLTGENPATMLLTSRYLDSIGKRDRILPILERAYFSIKSPAYKEGGNLPITKSILLSLIRVHYHLGNIEKAKLYLKEFEEIKNLSKEEREEISKIKSVLKK